MRWISVPCGSSSRGCVRGRWPDPEGQRRRWALFISLSIFNNLPEPSKSMKEMYTISKPPTYRIPNVSTHKTDSGWTVAYYSAILSRKKDCTQWTASTAGLRYRKQIRSVEAILCRTKLSGMIFSKVRTFRLQNKAFFQRCVFFSLVLTYGIQFTWKTI